MSTGVCGIICTNIHDVDYETKLAFFFEKKANELGIGTKMGGNISKYVYDKYLDERGKGGIIFELTDSPLDIHSERLFDLNDPEIQLSGIKIDNEDSLDSRMKRVQILLESLLKYEYVTHVVLEINYLFSTNESCTRIKLSDFCDTIVENYQNYEVFLPVIKLEIVL